MGGVEGDWEEEETCSRAFPLKLIGIIKGLKNNDKDEEDEKDDRGNEQARFESLVQERP